MRRSAWVVMLVVLTSACGMAPHQASSTADAPKPIVDAGGPIVSPSVVDAGP